MQPPNQMPTHPPPSATAAAWGRLAQAPTPPGKRGAEEFASGEQRQVSVQILGRPGRVRARCQAPPKMQSQGPTPGREDRVRAAKGSPYVRGGAGSRPPPAFHPAAGCRRAAPPCAGLAAQFAPDSGLSWHSHLLRRQLSFHIPESQCCGPEASDGQGQGQLPRRLLSTRSKGQQPCPLRDRSPSPPPSSLEGSRAHPTPHLSLAKGSGRSQ